MWIEHKNKIIGKCEEEDKEYVISFFDWVYGITNLKFHRKKPIGMKEEIRCKKELEQYINKRGDINGKG